MSNPDGQGEPSMEEILASIRRIISEDDKEESEQPGQDAGDSAQAEPEALAATDSVDDDILDLTDKAEDPSDAVSDPASAEDTAFAVNPEPETSPGDLPEDTAPDPFAALEEAGFGDELANAQQDNQDETADALAPDTLDDMTGMEVQDDMTSMPEPDFEEAGQTESAMDDGLGGNAVQDEPEAPMSKDNSEEGLVSNATAAATVAALSEASRDIRSQARAAEDLPIQSDKTLEGLVREAVKPLLKDWLDQNLAPLVERVVREEVRRMVRRAEDD
ncbi:DUF2497 domain-containing protein [Fodinicurvata sediminis]|uniref:DUF2497 domain-containing protein n=1 Tax=Fodinicurvata sediminis TaxID=1121832 RepID=UPI0003B6496C|nr:DUF2497 domain-containing protein [Fodinicurvata sediminis]